MTSPVGITAAGATGSSNGVLAKGAAAVAPQASTLPVPQPTTTSPTTTVSTPTTPSLQSLYPTAPTASTFNASTGTAASVGAAPTASASDVNPLAAINSAGTINPNDATNSASQLDAITAANSPYIQQAQNQGYLSAAARGMGNSSLGAGASEAAAVAAAAPLAEENAGEATQGQLQNSQLNTQANELNASQQNSNQQLQSQLDTQQTQFNAGQTQAAAATNAAAQNAIKTQTEQLVGQINDQYLSGSQAQTLASINGQYNELIQQNSSAAAMYTSALNNIGATLANANIPANRAADTISAMQSLVASGLGVIDAVNGASLTTTAPTTSYNGGVPTYVPPVAPKNVAPA